MMPNNTILIIALTWPEPNSTAAGSRMLQLMQCFLERGYPITFASTATETEFSADLSAIGVQKAQIQLNDSGFDDVIKNLDPQIVLFDRFITEEQFGWRVAEYAPNALRILDTEDLHSLRQAREAASKKQIEFSTEYWLQQQITKRELASIFRCDLSLIISSYEMELLTQVVNIDKSLLLHLPFMLAPIEKTKMNSWLPFAERSHFVCIGNGKHAPNVDAVLWLQQEIWPLIRRQLPKAQVHIYGAYLPQRINELHAPGEGFHIKGRAVAVQEVLGKARVNLAPLRFGAGIKGKLTDAMISGTPNVTTSIGAEGMHGVLPWSGTITDDATQFAQAAINLYQDKMAWRQAQHNGIAIINRCYDQKQLKEKLISSVERLRNKLKAHRTKNIIGAMLYHHTLASTKYLAKWIEGKNQR